MVSSLTATVTSVSAGNAYCLVTTNEQRAYAWGWGANGKLGDHLTDDHNVGNPYLLAETGIVKVSAGYDHSLMLTGKF